jgi:starch phosphorylase
MIHPIKTINIIPELPESLERLRTLAYNLRWAWNHDTIQLFMRLDRDLWEASGQNPVWMLGLVSQYQLDQAANSQAFMTHLDSVWHDYESYMQKVDDTWYDKNFGGEPEADIAYFSMEFGLTECLQNYSGGLGVLSGDHLKSSSDLNIPLIGVGLLYQEGYFRQYLNADGWQQESYLVNDYSNLPVNLIRDDNDDPVMIMINYPWGPVHAQLWHVQVGRIRLILLDSNISQNGPQDRDITDRLYGGDKEMRIKQEILLGMGGVRALRKLGYAPKVFHMNEGHSAFLALERIRMMMKEHDINFWQAKEITAAGNLLTVHTPVAAGLERFGFDLIEKYFSSYWNEVGISREALFDLGREDLGGYELFSMSMLGINMSTGTNGVSKLHGAISRDMWQGMWPGLPAKEVPIYSVTNGIHIGSWISREMAQLFDRYLSPNWREDPSDPEDWMDADEIPDAELWRTHERRRERLVAFARRRLRQQLERRGAGQSELTAASEVLNPDALTIGFARRFATYKRSTLLFRDPERLKKLLNDPDHPVQLLFAGKAHPHDNPGKELIRTIVHYASQPEFRHSIVFLEDYDMEVARYLVQGCDVWLNTPRRPREASGTSGMKVIYNGGLNASILDGWWAEGFDPTVGWAIGSGEEYEDQGLQDHIESQALYKILEQDIIPLFYNRGRDHLPREWIAMVKNSIRKLAPYFNTHRMLMEYTEEMYLAARERFAALTEDDLARGLALADWRMKVKEKWSKIKVTEVSTSDMREVKIGEPLEVSAWVDLGGLVPDDVTVQFYYGPVDTAGEIESGDSFDLDPTGEKDGNVYEFKGEIMFATSGERGVSVRVLPHHPDLATPFQRQMITWAG